MILSIILRIQDWKIMLKFTVYDGIVSILNFETHCSSSAASQIEWWSWQCCSSSEISFEDQVLDTGVCSGTFLWLFSPTWNTVKLTLKVGFICPFVVIDPTNLGATIVLAQAWCLTIFNLSPSIPRRRITNFLQMVIKLVYVTSNILSLLLSTQSENNASIFKKLIKIETPLLIFSKHQG